MKIKKVFLVLAVLAMAGTSLAGCQNNAPQHPTVSSDPALQTNSKKIILYQNAQPKEEIPISGEASFDALTETFRQTVENLPQSPAWVSSVVNEDFLKGYFENSEVLNITFGETHDFTIGSEHRVCDAVLLNAQNQEVIFVRDGQYQSGPLLIPDEDMQRIFQQAKNIQ